MVAKTKGKAKPSTKTKRPKYSIVTSGSSNVQVDHYLQDDDTIVYKVSAKDRAGPQGVQGIPGKDASLINKKAAFYILLLASTTYFFWEAITTLFS